VEGGHAEAGSVSSDPIVGLAALSNQLVIFKEHSVYRLLGDRPGNFTIEEVDSRAERTANTAVVKCGDALYFMTAGGLACFNGVTAEPLRDARRIRGLLKTGDVSASRGALCRDKLYFSMTDAEGDALIEYDLVRATYMLRRGFSVRGLCARAGALYLADGNRRVCRSTRGTPTTARRLPRGGARPKPTCARRAPSRECARCTCEAARTRGNPRRSWM
jgi:hypothetical protein